MTIPLHGKLLTCWNGWGRPYDAGDSRAATPLVPRDATQPEGSSVYGWGGVFLYDIESDPREEREISQLEPEVVKQMIEALNAYKGEHVSQSKGHLLDVHRGGALAIDQEECGIDGWIQETRGRHLYCNGPWSGPKPLLGMTSEQAHSQVCPAASAGRSRTAQQKRTRGKGSGVASGSVLSAG